MKTEEVKEQIVSLLQKINPNIETIEASEDIFTPDYRVAPRDMLVVCMELKKKYQLDLNSLVNELHSYSLNEIAEVVCTQIAGQS